MEAGDWTPDEWAALTADETAPEVPYQPWGPQTLTPEQLADADYVARTLLGFGAAHAGPLGWLLNYAVPHPKPGSATMRTVDTGLDYTGRFLGPLLALLGSQQIVLGKGGKVLPWEKKPSYTKTNDTLDQLEEWQRTKPWQHRPPRETETMKYWPPSPIGGPTGKGMTPEAVKASMEKDRFAAMLKQIRETEGLEAPMASPPARVSPPWGSDDDLLKAVLAKMKQEGRLGSARGRAELEPSFPLPPLPGD